MRRRKTTVTLFAVTMILAVLLPLSVVSAPVTKGTIKIATQAPLSGVQAVLGEGVKNGVQLAVQQMSGALKKAGWDVQVVSFDDQARPNVGVANARRIIADEEILAVIGHLNSVVALPSSEEYNAAGLAMISPANTYTKVTDRGYPTVNRVCGRDDVQGEAAARFAKDRLRAKAVYVLHDKTFYGREVAEFFRDTAKKLGMQVVGFEGTEEKSNFDPIITPIKARNPDVVYFGGIYEQAAIFLRQLRVKGVRATFLGPDGMDFHEFATIAGKAAVGAYYTTVAGPPTFYPSTKKFVADYEKKFGKDPEPFAAQAYDATAIALKAIERAAADGKKPTRKSVAAEIRRTKGFRGLTGTFTFDEKGDPVKAKYFILQVISDDPKKWGENKLVQTLEIAARKIRKM